MIKPTDPTRRYEVGKAYTLDEEALLNDPNSGTFFSLSIDKALNYMERDYISCCSYWFDICQEQLG